jgi:hypothetical protein
MNRWTDPSALLRQLCVFMTVLAGLVAAGTSPASALPSDTRLTRPVAADQADEFGPVQESCAAEVAVCRDFIGSVKLEPVNGGIRVSWTRGADETVTAPCGPMGYFGPNLGTCPVVSQAVKSSFDPVSATGGQWCEAASMADLSCTITGLKNGVQYAFHFTSRAGGVPWDNWALYVSPDTRSAASPCCSVPRPALAVAAKPVGNALDVTWAQPSDWGGAEELTYRVSTSPASSTCEISVLACRLENVPRGVPVTVNVTASNAAGTSSAASSVPVTIPVTAPEAPGAVTAKYPKAGTAKVLWTAPSNDGGKPITGYEVTSSPGGKTCITTGARSCVVTGLPGGKAYAFTVKAKNDVGTSVTSPVGVAGVLVNPASAPREVKVSMSGGSATVSWSRPANIGGGKLLQYIVRMGTSSCTTKMTSCTLNSLALGRTYSVSIIAVTTGGRSKPATASATTVAPLAVSPGKPAQEVT